MITRSLRNHDPSITGSAEPDPARPHAPGRRTFGARGVHLVVGVLVVALLTVEVVLAAPSVLAAAEALTWSSLSWLVVAAAATVASMVAFAGVRQRMLRAAGVRVGLTSSVAVSYAAGALNTTMPGGAVVSTAYTFRRIRGWGAPTAVATWCVAVTGLLATATLSVVGATGLILGGGSTGTYLRSAAEIGAVVLFMAGIALVTSNPDRLTAPAGAALRWINRMRGRPAETGYARLSRLLDDLRIIRPSRRAWIDGWTLSLLNWVLDAACLAACCAAFGMQVSLPALLLTYTAGMAATGLTPLPGGLGVVDAALLLGLTAAGGPWKAALAAVVIYRLLSVGSVAVIGWGVIGVRRATHPADSGDRADPPATATPVAPVTPDALVAPVALVAPDAPPRRPRQDTAAPEPSRAVGTVATVRPTEVQKPTRAGDVMATSPFSVAPQDSWQRVAKTMRRLQVSTVPVCDEHGELRGIIDYRDIGLRCLSTGGSPATAASLAQDPLVIVGPETPVDDVARLMTEQRVWLVPVLDGRRLMGVIHYADIVTGGSPPQRARVTRPEPGDDEVERESNRDPVSRPVSAAA